MSIPSSPYNCSRSPKSLNLGLNDGILNYTHTLLVYFQKSPRPSLSLSSLLLFGKVHSCRAAHPPRSIFQNAQSPPSYCHHHHQHHCQCHCHHHHHHHKFSQPRVNPLVLFLIFSSKPTHHLKSVHFVQFSKLPDLIRLSLRHCANLNSCIGSLKTCSALLRSCSPRQQIFVVYWWSCSSGPTVIINVSAT